MDQVTLTLRPDPDVPPDLPFRVVQVGVPLHPEARPVEVDSMAPIGFPVGIAYRSRAEPVSFVVPGEMADTFDWFDELFSREGYSRQMSKGRSTNTRTGEFGDWMVLTVSPRDNLDLILKLTFRPYLTDGTLLTSCAEEHPTPPRDRASYLSGATQCIEVQYTFWNGPQRTIHRTVTDPATIRTLVNALNALPADKRLYTGGTFWPGWADLRFFTPGEPERKVHIDASHSLVVIDGVVALLGNPWRLLIEAAPPPKGASGIPGMDWEDARDDTAGKA